MIEGWNDYLIAFYSNHNLLFSLFVLFTTIAAGVALETITGYPQKE